MQQGKEPGKTQQYRNRDLQINGAEAYEWNLAARRYRGSNVRNEGQHPSLGDPYACRAHDNRDESPPAPPNEWRQPNERPSRPGQSPTDSRHRFPLSSRPAIVRRATPGFSGIASLAPHPQLSWHHLWIDRCLLRSHRNATFQRLR